MYVITFNIRRKNRLHDLFSKIKLIIVSKYHSRNSLNLRECAD